MPGNLYLNTFSSTFHLLEIAFPVVYLFVLAPRGLILLLRIQSGDSGATTMCLSSQSESRTGLHILHILSPLFAPLPPVQNETSAGGKEHDILHAEQE